MYCRLALPGLLLLLSPALLFAESRAPKARHVILISIDGLRPSLYLRERPRPPWHSILTIKDAGAYALSVAATYPSLTYPGHTTIATGVWPERHRVSANNVFDPPAVEGRGYWYAEDVKAPALWDRAHAAGLTVAALSWPCTADSKAIDWNFPEFWTTGRGSERELMGKSATPDLLTLAVKLAGHDWADELKQGHERDLLLGRLAEQLILLHQPNLILLHLVEPDKMQHRYGVESQRVGFSMRRMDRIIERLRAACEKANIAEDTAIILVGDHGFADVSWNIAPNTLLAERGLLHYKEGRLEDWKAFVQNTGGSAAVYLKDKENAEVLNEVREVLKAGATDPDGEPVFELVSRSDASALGAPSGPAFFLEAAPGYMFTSACSGPLIRGSALAANHGYWPANEEMKTGFIAGGSGIRKKKLGEIRLVDVAPTVAALLGFDFPNVEGRVLTEILY